MAPSYQTGSLTKRKLKDGSVSYRLTYHERRPTDGAWGQKVLQSSRVRPCVVLGSDWSPQICASRVLRNRTTTGHWSRACRFQQS
jgi:hypothetical protein